ncbi:transposase [Paenibacillus thiaminolyticus]|uniref:Transposase n=1 Tax=Paenibacillus thiaminolyticus TaxID=49283 RepID=A0A3A3GRA6_PANTH|nr:transposase [Paenibacillus thiaminolyticus]RJG25915.1 transposase [Paenibacillus thiaminolyticus]
MRKKWSVQEKLVVLQALKSGQGGIETTAKMYGIGATTHIEWRDRYEQYGYKGLEHLAHNRSYSTELKLQAVKDYLSGKFTQSRVIHKC